ncbi:MAG: hypothetical protein ACRCZI_03530, partial [Cetobacterium sp.]
MSAVNGTIHSPPLRQEIDSERRHVRNARFEAFETSAVNDTRRPQQTERDIRRPLDKRRTNMTRGARGRGRGSGRGTRGRGSQGRSGGSRTSSVSDKKKGLCAALGSHVFDYGDKASADQLRVSWEKLCNHVGTLYGQDISTELSTGTTVQIP